MITCKEGDKKSNYFAKRDPDEDDIIDIHIHFNISQRYQMLENTYNEIVPPDSYDSAKIKSRCDRSRLGLDKKTKNFVYGEIPFRTMAYVFETIKQKYGQESIMEGNFYDLGSVRTF
jgi:hypothetical protein